MCNAKLRGEEAFHRSCAEDNYFFRNNISRKKVLKKSMKAGDAFKTGGNETKGRRRRKSN